MAPADPHEISKRLNQKAVRSIEKRAAADGSVIKFCLDDYRARPADADEHPLLNLTRHLVDTFAATRASIQERMEQKHAGKADFDDLVNRSVRNSLMRSAGTNYQGLVTYAIAAFLLDQESNWYVQHPVPLSFGRSLAIKFSGPVVEADEGDVPDGGEDDGADDGPEEVATVDPDVDIVLRNAAWDPETRKEPEPILLLSVKTSLADRAGSAARWKNYFDIVTKPCPHAAEEDCAYRRLGMELAEDPQVDITHGIVTANIYKINSDPKFAEWGELRTGQARSNTFMFDLRYSTRNENEKVMAPGWGPLVELASWLDETANRHGLPA